MALLTIGKNGFPMPRNLDPEKAATTAAAAIQSLNHITLNGKITAPQLSATVQALLGMVRRLDQTFDQLGQQLDGRLREDDISMDTGEDPAAVVPGVREALAESCAAAEVLAAALQKVASPLWQMAAR